MSNQSPNGRDGTDTENDTDEKPLEPVCACNLPEPDTLEEGRNLPRQPPPSEPTPKVGEPVVSTFWTYH
jgi:hypothetical protein